jgi:hypothetical protein
VGYSCQCGHSLDGELAMVPLRKGRWMIRMDRLAGCCRDRKCALIDTSWILRGYL